MADDWQSLTELAATPATDDEVLVKDTSDTTDDAVGTVKRNSRTNFLGSILGATTASFTTTDETKLDGIEALADVTDAANVAAAGAHMAGGTDVPVADGGTGASTASDARTNLGLVIGTHVQAFDADLTAIAAAFTPASAAGPTTLAFAEDTDNGVNTISLSAPSSITSNVTVTLQATSGQVYSSNGTDVAVLDGGTGASTAATARTNLGLVIGTDVAPVNNAVFTGTVTIPDGALAIADTAGLQSALDLKAPLASPTFTTALTAANPTFTGTVTIPDGALAIADTSGLQSALDLKAPLASPTFTGTVTVPNDAISYAEIQNVSATDCLLGRSTAGAGDIEEITCTAAARSILDDTTVAAILTTIGGAPAANPVFTGTVTIPDGALAIADTSGLQTALDGKQPLDTDLTTLATAFTSASSAGPASLKLAEDTDAGSTGVILTGPATSASDKAVTFQDIAGTVYVSGGTDVAVADGGTGAGDAATARTNLGLVIGTNVQAQDAELAAIAGLTSAADQVPYFTGSGTAALTTVTSAARGVLDDTTVAAMLASLGGLPLAGGTLTGALVLGSGATIDGGGKTIAHNLQSVVTGVSGTLTITAHSGNTIVTNGNITVPSTVGFHCTVILGGAHTITFANNGSPIVSAALATGDIVSIVVQTITSIKAVRVLAANLLAFA